MISNLWIAHRKNNWERLETLIRQAESDGIRTFTRSDLRDFGLLYRQAATDLSTVRADHSSRALEHYLNRLVGRAHNFVYSGHRISVASLWRFFAHGYPRLLRRLAPYVVASAAILIVSGLLGSLITLIHPSFATAMLGPLMMDKIEHHQMWTDAILSVKPEASSAIMTNNISVCFAAFAGGILGGLGTLFLLFNNGLELGVVATTCASHHLALSLWSFVAAHGALELPSIALAGAAGLRLGTGVLFPGTLRRGAALAQAASEAVQLLAGTVPLLIIAGTLEAFLSPTHAPIPLKFAVGAALFTGLCWWLGEGGRRTIPTATPA
jgi:uncharacterized membrane protein SpoIIM required for sporulation